MDPGEHLVMTTPQRITLMADWWPKACRAQGWNKNDKAKRLEVLSAAVKRDVTSANELNATSDIDAVKAHLGMLASNVAATIETDRPDIGRARRLRNTIGDQLKCLALYHENAPAWLASVIRDKFKHGSRVMPLTADDLSAEPVYFTDRKTGKPREIPSQLDQIVMTLSRAIQAKRKEQGDTLHTMKTRAGIHCGCRTCRSGTADRRVFHMPAPVLAHGQEENENEPF